MASINLSFASTRAMITVLRQALVADPLFQPDKTGPSRSGETFVLDAWGYQQRDFPCLVVTGKPGTFRRMGIGDKVRNFFGVNLVEEPGGTNTLRTFDVPLVTVVGSSLNLDYSGDATGMSPQPPFVLPVQQNIVSGNPVNYVTLAGPNVGATNFPLKNFGASTPNYPTGMVFGGFYDMTMEITASGRNTQSRDMLSDRAEALVWIEKKRALRQYGVIVLDVAHAGFAKIPYGADQIYQSKISVSVAVEFAAIAQYISTVTDIAVVGTAAA
jgi:hypothetical protein